MAGYPAGGIVIQNNDVSVVELFDCWYKTDVFEPTTASRVYPAGLLLGRATASGKLTPYTTDDTPAGSGTLVGVLGSQVTADATPNDVNLRYIARGTVRQGQLSIDDTSASQVITDAILDALKSAGILALPVDELTSYDNPQ